VHVKKLTWGNRWTTALSLAGKGRVVAEKCAIHSTVKVSFPPWLNTLYNIKTQNSSTIVAQTFTKSNRIYHHIECHTIICTKKWKRIMLTLRKASYCTIHVILRNDKRKQKNLNLNLNGNLNFNLKWNNMSLILF
jgi:hypothetical protein